MFTEASTSTSAPRDEHPRGHDLVVEQPAGDVDVVHARVVDDHLVDVVRRDRGVAVRGVEEQRRADLPRLDRRLHGAVGRVVATHEPDHDQALARGDLGVDDALARLAGGRERLLAEHLLARLDAGQHVLLVRGTPRGDDDRVDLGVRDELLPGLQGLGGGQARRHGLGPFHVHIGHRGDPRAGEHVGQAADVVLPDHSDADDADVECHGELVLPDQYGQRRVGPTPQAAK
jgi:hypothetical protein